MIAPPVIVGVRSAGAPPAPPVTPHAYFDGLVASGRIHVPQAGKRAGLPCAWSLRSQDEIDAVSLIWEEQPTNPDIRYPPTWPGSPDAAELVVKGDDHPAVIADPAAFMNGTHIGSDLVLDYDFDQPTGSNRYLLTGDYRYGPGWADQIWAPDSPWHGQKTMRFSAKPSDETGTASWFKLDETFRRSQSPDRLTEKWSKVNAAIDVGLQDDGAPWDRDPVAPNRFQEFFIAPMRWSRFWILVEEHDREPWIRAVPIDASSLAFDGRDWIATVVTAEPHGLRDGERPHIQGANEPGYNAAWPHKLRIVDQRTFTYEVRAETAADMPPTATGAMHLTTRPAVDAVSCWFADEERDPMLVVDRLRMALPWDPVVGAGCRALELRVSPKSDRTSGPTCVLSYRNFAVLKNPGPIEDYLERPIA